MNDSTASGKDADMSDTNNDDAATNELPRAIRISESLRKLVDGIGRFGSWMFLPMILITVFDVILRKVGAQYWLTVHFGRIFDSTVLQELEWHFHTGLFALVLGYGYIWNTHVRVDLVREHLDFRKKAWLEFLGLTVFLIPYCSIVIWFSFEYAYDSWAMNEISASTVGLTHRWIIKSVLVLGLIMAVVAGIAVWLQVVMVLWGPRQIRFPLMTLEWPEEEGTRLEGKTRLVLEEMEDELERRERVREDGGENGQPSAATPEQSPPPESKRSQQ